MQITNNIHNTNMRANNMMFLKYNFRDAGHLWAGTIRASQILSIDYEVDQSERETDGGIVIDEYYTINFTLNEICDRTVFETESIQKMEAVNSAICLAMATGEPQFLTDIGFCEPFWMKDDPCNCNEQAKNEQKGHELQKDRPKFLSDPD